MFNEKLSHCPSCGQKMEQGFSVRNTGLSWVAAEKMKQFAFMDKDLNETGFKKLLPAKAEYDLSYHCPDCKIYIVDYSKAVSRAQANELAEGVLRDETS